MRVCFASDLHGRAELYAQLDALVETDPPRLLILGGDMLPDSPPDDPCAGQGRFLRDVFLPRIERWRTKGPEIEVACICGNHDWKFIEGMLEEAASGRVLHFLEHTSVTDIGGMRFLGYSETPWTPHWLKDFERLDCDGDPLPQEGGTVWDAASGTAKETTPEEHYGKLPSMAAELARAVTPGSPWIFVCHAPPHGTRLDRLPGVDHPIGSRAVRRFIEQRRPLLALHGHVHESPAVTRAYVDYVGGVLCVNPGQGEETLHAVHFDTEDPAGSLRHTVLG